MTLRPLATCLAAAVLLCSSRADAASRCDVLSVTGVAFGSYDTQSPEPLDSAGAISVQCFDVTAADRVRVELGRGTQGSYIPRLMYFRGSRFEYNLYLDAARTVWGNGTAGTSVFVGHPPDGGVLTLQVYGRIPPKQNVRPGSYNDTVLITLVY